MMESTNMRVPSACTLPTREQPLRAAEFDALFAETPRAVERPAAPLVGADRPGNRRSADRENTSVPRPP